MRARWLALEADLLRFRVDGEKIGSVELIELGPRSNK
jgi:hypothetical protein